MSENLKEIKYFDSVPVQKRKQTWRQPRPLAEEPQSTSGHRSRIAPSYCDPVQVMPVLF